VNRQVLWHRRALADLAEIGRHSPRQARRIRGAVNRYATDDQGDVVKMAGRSGVYRLRVGDWRVLFTFGDGGRTVDVARVLRRNEGTYRG
jgi:mRNA-degrading endonuclease RelE of RelBE toxin-antitoxin system